ncbi:hypothetical protein CVT24_000813 [Panaeolus cyanescens]|uniref:F-box domain-containing protein n=1 Tax=Panaeolus cyanescens TaxID=181874 RepID=A0A409YCU3_9AGAR|nr:hypothetical protein CVT24_000813 [Panaeolus cyanescens]
MAMDKNLKIHPDRAFPLEIFDLIVKEYASKCYNPYREMQSCALVCKDFAFLARPYIYNSVEFGPYGINNRNRLRLAEAFISSPRLGSSVKRVWYTIVHSKSELRDVSPPVNEPQSLVQPLTTPNIDASSSLHEFLTGVEDVRIAHLEVERHDAVCLDEECTRLSHALLKGLASSPFSNVTSLVVQSIRLNFKVILSMPSLRDLTSECCDWWSPWDDPGYDEEELQDITYPPHLLLQCLFLEQDRGFPLKLLFHFPDLESIEFRINKGSPTRHFPSWLRKNPDVRCFQNPVVSFENLTTIESNNAKVLSVLCRNATKKNAHAFPSLRTFIFRCDQNDTDDTAEALYDVLPHMPALQNFETTIKYRHEWLGDNVEVQPGRCLNFCRATLETFRIRFSQLHEIDFSANAFRLRNLVAGLRSISGSNRIKDLEIEFAQVLRGEELNRWKKSTLPVWKQLDALIADSSMFPALKTLTLSTQVSLSFEERHSITHEKKYWQVDFWPDAFPSLHTAGYQVEHAVATYNQSRYSFIRLPNETIVGTVLEEHK